jgi:bisphosphoglycerate-independent phosphoglycerate mutase (AlkP superfamily)
LRFPNPGVGEHTTTDKVLDVVQARYAAGELDEFLKPIIVDSSMSLSSVACLFKQVITHFVV